MSLIDRIRKYKNNLNNNWWFYSTVANQLSQINKDYLQVLEVGTAFGDSSTLSIYRNLKATKKPFELVGYEPIDVCYNPAFEKWQNVEDVQIIKKYFLTKGGIKFFREKIALEKLNPKLEADVIKNTIVPEHLLVDRIENKPDLIFIDSIRYSHLAIIKSIVELELHKNTIIVMEDDIPNFGEIGIIGKYFELKNVNKHRCFPHQWPFVTYNIVDEIK